MLRVNKALLAVIVHGASRIGTCSGQSPCQRHDHLLFDRRNLIFPVRRHQNLRVLELSPQHQEPVETHVIRPGDSTCGILGVNLKREKKVCSELH